MAGETQTFTGVFSTSEVKVEIDKTPNDSTPTWKEIADMETAKISIETNVETWYSIKDGGWQNALATAKSFKVALSGKRCIGDDGNDYIAGLALKNGRDLNTNIKFTFPDGATFEGGIVCAVTDFNSDGATNVGPLVADCTGRGKPTYTPATSSGG